MALASRMALVGRIHRLGRRDDVPGLLRAADILVLPSLWEGMPNVVLEAMAARLAVVATDVEGTEDLVLPGRTGWLVPPRDVEALAEALLQAAANPLQTRRRGAAGRARVESQFRMDRIVRDYENLWSRVLGHEPVSRVDLEPSSSALRSSSNSLTEPRPLQG